MGWGEAGDLQVSGLTSALKPKLVYSQVDTQLGFEGIINIGTKDVQEKKPLLAGYYYLEG